MSDQTPWRTSEETRTSDPDADLVMWSRERRAATREPSEPGAMWSNAGVQISDKVGRKKDLPSVSGGLTGRALLNDSL